MLIQTSLQQTGVLLSAAASERHTNTQRELSGAIDIFHKMSSDESDASMAPLTRTLTLLPLLGGSRLYI